MAQEDLPTAAELFDALEQEYELARLLEEKYSSSWENLRRASELERGIPYRGGWQLTLDLRGEKRPRRSGKFR